MARMQKISDALGRAQAVLQVGGTQLAADGTMLRAWTSRAPG